MNYQTHNTLPGDNESRGIKIRTWNQLDQNQDPANRCSGHDTQPDNQMELIRGFCYLGSRVEADGGQRSGGMSACCHRTRLHEQPPAQDLEDWYPYWHKALLVPGIHSSNPPVWHRNLDTHQSPGDKAACLPTLVFQRDPARSLLGSFIHSFTPVISIAPLQVLYYSQALPTTARILCRSFTPKRIGNCR